MFCRKMFYLSLLETTAVDAQWHYLRIHFPFAVQYLFFFFFLPNVCPVSHRFFLSHWEAFCKRDNQFAPSLLLFLKAIPSYSDTRTFYCFTDSGNSKYWLVLKTGFLFVFYNLLNRLIDLWLTGTVALYSIWESLKPDLCFPVRTANAMSRKYPKMQHLWKILQHLLYTNLGNVR